MTSLSDNLLLEQIGQGDVASFEVLFHQHYDRVYGLLFRLLGNRDEAEDVTQEVFLKLHDHTFSRRFLQRNREHNIGAWLYRTAHNIVIDYYRRQRHRQHLPLEEGLVNAGDDPVRVAEDQILAAEVHSALGQLTVDQRQVITLKFLAGLSNEETATMLDKPVGAVKSLQHRALAALQRQLVRAKEKIG